MPADRALYFVAIVPPEPVLGELLRLKEQLSAEYHSRAALRSPPHITLHMPFQYRTDRQDRIEHALAKIKGEPMSVQLKNFSAFPPRVIFVDVVPDPALKSLQSEVHRSMKKHLNVFNADYKSRGFHPHLTVLFRDLKKAEFARAWNDLKEKDIQYTFETSDICLLRHNGKEWQIAKRIGLERTG